PPRTGPDPGPTFGGITFFRERLRTIRRRKMSRSPSVSRSLLAAGAGCSLLLSVSASAGTVTGTVTYDGKVPNLKPLAMDAEHVFDKPEDPFQIKCDVHPWMTAYTMVATDPFFFVTKEDGKFTIANLPAGTYEIEAWHEKLGKKVEKVTVGDSDTKTVDFKFSP